MHLRRVIMPFAYALALVSTATLTSSCSDADELIVDKGDKKEHTIGDGTYAIQIQIKSSDGEFSRSRADYDDGTNVDGTDFEHRISASGSFALFFNAERKLYEVSPLQLSKTPEYDDNVEVLYTTTLKLDGEDDDDYPRYCLVILNGQRQFETLSDAAEAGTATIESVLQMVSTEAIGEIGRNNDGLFVMTNSIYVNNDGTLHTADAVTEDMIYDASDPTAKARAKKLVIYVERMLAKFTLNIDRDKASTGEYLYEPGTQQFIVFNGFDGATGAPTYATAKWAIALTGWNMNAYEPTSYLFKKLNPTGNYFADWRWNAPELYRSYWCEDGHYTGEYPMQYRQAVDTPLNYYADFESRGINQLHNFSYADLKLDEDNLSDTIYTPENTYDIKAIQSGLDDRADMLAGTHLLIGARLKIDRGNGFTISDLWRDREGFFYTSELDCFKALMYAFQATLESQQEMRFTFYNWSGTKPTYNGMKMYADTNGDYALYYENGGTSQKVTTQFIDSYFSTDFLDEARIRQGDGKRMLWPAYGTFAIRNSQGVAMRILDASKTATVTYAADEDFVRSLIYEWMGAVDHYNMGRMYYAAPAVMRNSTSESMATICGVVRNNWYYYNLTDIKTIGTPVDNINQPIVPDKVNNKEQVNLTINIIPWHYTDIYAPIF